jgi:phosphatidylglycerol---prolipoprotein diacylglyceryl transferase
LGDKVFREIALPIFFPYNHTTSPPYHPTTTMLPYPHIDPIALKLGPLVIRWYALAYIGGILLGWWLIAREFAARPLENLSKKALDDTISWAVIGIILGGRLGYVLFYKPDYYLANPVQILHVWEGGMSFHGGLIGFIAAFYLFSRRHKISFLGLMDVLACVAPIGIFLGRMANFINGELWGRVTDSAFGMIFPTGGELPRHPSQLYEAGLEGVVLFVVLMWLLKKTNARQYPGMLSGIFLIGYALARITAECFREPDAFLGFFAGGITMGQILSLPMLGLGIYLAWRSSKH